MGIFAPVKQAWDNYKDVHPLAAARLKKAGLWCMVGGAGVIVGAAIIGGGSALGVLLPAAKPVGFAVGNVIFKLGILGGSLGAAYNTTRCMLSTVREDIRFRTKPTATHNDSGQVCQGPRSALRELELAQTKIKQLSASFNRVAKPNAEIEREIQQIIDSTAGARKKVRVLEMDDQGQAHEAQYKFVCTKPRPRTP